MNHMFEGEDIEHVLKSINKLDLKIEQEAIRTIHEEHILKPVESSWTGGSEDIDSDSMVEDIKYSGDMFNEAIHNLRTILYSIDI